MHRGAHVQGGGGAQAWSSWKTVSSGVRQVGRHCDEVNTMTSCLPYVLHGLCTRQVATGYAPVR